MTFLNYSGIKKVKEKLRTINKNDYIIFFLIGILLLIMAAIYLSEKRLNIK